MYKLLIFDWDGTIINSESRIISSMQSAAKECGFEIPGDEQVRNIIGLGLPEALRLLIKGIDEVGIERMRASYGHYFMSADSTPSPLFPGVQHSLESMHRKGMRMAVATGKSRKGLSRAFVDTGLAYLFEASRCADETTSKPDPHMLEELVEETGVQPSEALMIGDTEYDLEMGKRAGMDVLAVSYGAHHIDRLKGYEPVLEVDHFPDIEKWLEKKGVFA